MAIGLEHATDASPVPVARLPLLGVGVWHRLAILSPCWGAAAPRLPQLLGEPFVLFEELLRLFIPVAPPATAAFTSPRAAAITISP